MNNAINTLSFTGTVMAHGVKGTTYPSLWIKVQLQPLKIGYLDSTIDRNIIFVNMDIDLNTSSRRGAQADYIKKQLNDHSFILVKDATFALISRSKKLEDGTWETSKEPGIKSNVRNIYLSKTEFNPLNLGALSGVVSNQSENRIILEQSYTIPSKGKDKETTGTRSLPLLLDTDIPLTDQYKGREIVCYYSLAGATPDGKEKTFGISSRFVIV